MSQKGIGSVCPRCGKEFNGDECEHCGYGSERDKQVYGYKDDDLNSLPFPQNNATTACYVAAIILAAATILLYSSTSPAFTLLMAGVACVIAGVGKGVHTLYLALLAVYDVVKRNKQ